ncbi:hypothetical protein [Halobacteriovorax sp.]|uniref:hypothetical protein n=1 Tax=Halobacteriovorax sp. TaxID=2020862 RepID=UPI003AF2DD82
MKNKCKLRALLFLLLNINVLAISVNISTYKSRNEIVKRESESFGRYIVVKFGVFDLKTKKLKVSGASVINKYQEEDLNCLEPIIKSATMSETQLEDFSKFVEFNDRFFQTQYGVLVEKSCLEKSNRKYIESNILKSYKDGLSCLQELDGEGSKELLLKMNNLFSDSDNKPKIFCSETNQDIKSKGINWTDAKAYASASDEFSSNEMKHPFISLGQQWRWQDNAYSFRGTLFHEFIHNTGCIHTKTIEKSYTCQTCCFSEIDNPNAMMSPAQSAVEQKEVACKICRSTYEGITDKNYLRDYAKFSILGGQTSFLLPVLKSYMKERPGDDFAVEIFVEADNNGPLAKALLSNKGPVTKYELLAEIVKEYAKGNYVQSAKFIRKLKQERKYFRNTQYSSIYEEIEKDLLFMSFGNPEIKLQADNPFNSLFKQSKDFLSSPVSLK